MGSTITNLLFHELGGGNFLSYQFLLSALLSLLNGCPVNATLQVRNDKFSILGLKSDLQLETLTKAVFGFAQNCQDEKEDWVPFSFSIEIRTLGWYFQSNSWQNFIKL